MYPVSRHSLCRSLATAQTHWGLTALWVRGRVCVDKPFAPIPRTAPAGTATPLNSPVGVTSYDTSGSLYISDLGSAVVRRLQANGTMTVVAGSLGTTGTTGNNVPGTSAFLKSPRGLTLLSSSAVLIADATAVRILYPNRTLSTLIGTVRC